MLKLPRFCKSRKFIIFLIFLFYYPSLSALDKPLKPVIYAGSTGEIELYWFYPGLHYEILGNVRVQADDYFFVSEKDRQYSVLTRFPINPPVTVSQASTYISANDVFPDYPGNQFSPIGLSLKKRAPEGEFTDYWQQLVCLDSSVSGNGARVDCQTEILLKNKFDIWAGLEWQPGIPTAPLIGVNLGPRTLEQYICPMDDSAFELQECNDEYMIGLELLNWTSDDGYTDQMGVNDSMFFSIYYGADTTDFISSCIRVDSLGIDSLYSKPGILSDGYLNIAASDGVESKYSDFVRVDIDKLPSVVIQPTQVNGLVENGEINAFVINIQNTGDESVPMMLNYDRDLLTVSADSFSIPGGENTDIEITPVFKLFEDSLINTTIIINTSDTNYPIIYHLQFSLNEPSLVDEGQEIQPSGFFVSQPWPNPFNSSVMFNLKTVGKKRIAYDIYNILGQNINSGELLPEKSINFYWNGTDRTGQTVSTGVYFFRFATDDYQVFRKALLIK